MFAVRNEVRMSPAETADFSGDHFVKPGGSAAVTSRK
jgi:hypothetical protein